MKTTRTLLLSSTLIALTLAASAQSFTNHTYQWIPGAFTWQEAKADAEQRGGHLATITSEEEMVYVISVLPNPLPAVQYWLGGTDEGHEGIWVWITGEPWSYTSWNSGEPNNASGNENHLAGVGQTILWNDTEAPSPYLLEIDYCSPHAATATAIATNGFVVGAVITDGGCGYTNAPLVLIQSGGGSGATATAVISNGVVVGINVTSAGCCYTNVPKIVIASPPFVPTLSIRASKVKVTQNVVLGRNYVLESSSDLTNWAAVGPPFTATSESVTDEFDVDFNERFFRIRQVP